MSVLKGKVCVVTGAGRGIGAEIARRFSSEGAYVAVCDVDADSASKMAQEIEASGGRAISGAVDVTDASAVDAFCNRVVEDLGSLDILVNNAGISIDSLLVRFRREDWDKVLAVNLTGAFNFCKAAARPMMKKRWGRIVNISSVIAIRGNAGQSAYAASKAGLIGLTKSLAHELAARNITVNAVAPGFIETPMTDRLSDDVKDSYFKQIPMSRFGKPSEVADAVLFLAGEGASYITGQVLHVNGGLLMP